MSEKAIPANYATEIEGVLALQSIVHEAQWIWRQPAGPDVGIDGEIEPVMGGRTPTGQIIKVQVKSGPSYFEREDGLVFAFRAAEKDITYWRRVNTPVLLVIYDPRVEDAYAVEVHAHLAANPASLTDRLVWFHRERDQLTPGRLRELFGEEAEEVFAPVAAVCAAPERLHSNVLPVLERPEWVFHAPTPARTRHDVRRLVGDGPIPPYVLWRDELWTFADLTSSDSRFRSAVDHGKARRQDAARWLFTKDGEIRYLTLTYEHLKRALWRAGLEKDARHGRFYLPTKDGANRTEEYRSLKKRTKRIVAEQVWSRDRSLVRYWRHRAVNLALVRVSGRWIATLTPGWAFTTDGRTRRMNPPAGTVTRLNARAYNASTYRLSIFWREILAQGGGIIDIPCEHQRLRLAKSFMEAAADFGVPGDCVDLGEVVDDEEPLPDIEDPGESTEEVGDDDAC